MMPRGLKAQPSPVPHSGASHNPTASRSCHLNPTEGFLAFLSPREGTSAGSQRTRQLQAGARAVGSVEVPGVLVLPLISVCDLDESLHLSELT